VSLKTGAAARRKIDWRKETGDVVNGKRPKNRRKRRRRRGTRRGRGKRREGRRKGRRKGRRRASLIRP